MPHRAIVPPVVLLAALSVPPSGLAQALPEPVQQALPGASLTGQMRFRFWGFEVYDARLWTAPGFRAAAYEGHPLALELQYLRDFRAVDLVERSIQEMRRIATVTAEQERRWASELQRIFPDVRKGERLLGVHRPGQGAAFWFNGQPRGEILDAEFARVFFGLWLSPRTPEPALRQALLGASP